MPQPHTAQELHIFTERMKMSAARLSYTGAFVIDLGLGFSS